MNYIKNILLFLFAGSQLSTIAGQEKVVPFAFGDMDQWVVREIQESGIIGGNKKHLYEVGPTDTIVGNTAYHNRGGSPWANSNVMAKVAGQDSIAAILFLQKRWEDKEGNIYAKRVGTMVQRYVSSTDGWVNDATYPIMYGNISGHADYKPYMCIQVEERYATNSQGESVPVKEIGWAEEGDEPTHMVLQFTSSHGGAYIGSPGNTFWIDNVKLVY